MDIHISKYVSGSKARERWFWAIVRVLRHVGKTNPPTFTNPLRRKESLKEAVSLSPKYSSIFDYSPSNKPPLNSGHYTTNLSKSASAHLISLCRSTNLSIGAGCFALVALSMMEIYESLNPSQPDSQRPAFAAGFTLNPRPFFGLTTQPDSCMLAFNDGIIMPFLSSSLPIEGRFKLTARIANRQLRAYQKRLKSSGQTNSFDPTSPGRVLAQSFLTAVERAGLKLPAHRRTGVNPQGAYPAKVSRWGPTCVISSVGSLATFFKPGTYDLGDVGGAGGKDLVADYRGLRIGVRVRDNEFLVVASTDSEGIVGIGVSYDACAIDEAAAAAWGEKIRGLLEVDGESKL